MLAELINGWDIFCSFLQGTFYVFSAFAKILFTMTILPLTIMYIVGFFIKRRFH